MARINQNLLRKLQAKSGLSGRQIYRLIQEKVRITHLERHLAAVLVAEDYKLNIAKYASAQDLATIRGATASPKSADFAPRPINTIVKKVVKANEPIMIDLRIVTGAELRRILERDIAELNAARSQGLEKTAKTCMVLCGSIIEALLLDKLSQNLAASVAVASSLPPNQQPRSPHNPEEWNLKVMINVAVRLTPPLLPDDATTGAHQLRNWRNLIHPGRELKEAQNRRIKPTRERANNAIAFLLFIAKELA
jgi:hypothetical protein